MKGDFVWGSMITMYKLRTGQGLSKRGISACENSGKGHNKLKHNTPVSLLSELSFANLLL